MGDRRIDSSWLYSIFFSSSQCQDARSWECYLNVDNVIKVMITALRSVGELQNPAIRDRHWEELIAMTKTSFVMSDDVQLKDLLALGLDQYEEEVKTIVDKAVKELG